MSVSRDGATDIQWHKPRDFMLPSTFEERGAVVPFTTPALAYSRVRKGWRDQLELVLGQFAGTIGYYVMPWKSLEDLFTLTAHDLMLADEVTESKALDPYSMRLAALKVTRTGVAGPQASEAAANTLKLDQEYRALQKVVLILKVIELVEKSATAELMRDMMDPEGQARIRATLGRVVRRLEIDQNIFEARLSELGDAMAALGVSWNPQAGRLRQLMTALQLFRGSIAVWAAGRPPEQADQARFCGEVAALTLELAGGILQEIDKTLVNPFAVLNEWDKQMPPLSRQASRLSWLLDGWEPIIHYWEASEGAAERVETLHLILPILPLIPRDELFDVSDMGAAFDLQIRGKRWVKANENWRTGRIDAEMVRRLETIKALAT